MPPEEIALLRQILTRLERVERLAQSYSLDQGRTLSVMKDGFRMVVDVRSVDLGQWLIRNGEWEGAYSAILRKLIRPDEVLVDVGANQGWYTLMAANLIKQKGWTKTAQVTAIEPNIELCDNIRTSLFANGFQSYCKVLNQAVSDREERLFLATLEDMKGSSTTRRRSGALRNQGQVTETEVDALPLDNLLSAPNARMPTLIKADVEGWEGVMLNGARRILKDSPGLRMMLEWSVQMDATPFGRRASGEMLGDLGFRVFTVEGTKLVEAAWGDLMDFPGLMNLYIAREDLVAVIAAG